MHIILSSNQRYVNCKKQVNKRTIKIAQILKRYHTQANKMLSSSNLIYCWYKQINVTFQVSLMSYLLGCQFSIQYTENFFFSQKEKKNGIENTKEFIAKAQNFQLLTVSKLPLCIKSMGGRNRSARVVSFLSMAPPFLNSCSCRTEIQDEEVSTNHKRNKSNNIKNMYQLQELLNNVFDLKLQLLNANSGGEKLQSKVGRQS